jgi:hypothetical protein
VKRAFEFSFVLQAGESSNNQYAKIANVCNLIALKSPKDNPILRALFNDFNCTINFMIRQY